MSLGWPGNASGSPRKRWWKWPGRGKPGPPCLGRCPRDPIPGQAADDDDDDKFQQSEFQEFELLQSEFHRFVFLDHNNSVLLNSAYK